MIVSHQHKFIFIKTQKTMGTSIEIALSEFCGEGDILTTLKADEAIRRELGYRGVQNTEISFRHRGLTKYSRRKWLKVFLGLEPYPQIREHADAAFARAFLGEKIWNQYFKFCFERNPFDKAISQYYWVTKKLTPRPEINARIQSMGAGKLSNWGSYALGGRIAMDFAGRFERVNRDLEIIKARLGLPEISLPETKVGIRKDRRHYSEILNEKTRAHIERLCANEIREFGYVWEAQPAAPSDQASK